MTPLVLWWFLFVLLAAREARDPGFVVGPGPFAYPILGVVAVAGVLAFLTTVLRLILGPQILRTTDRRLGLAIAVFFGLSLISVVTYSTDLTGHAYVPDMFVWATLLGLLLLAAERLAARRCTRKGAV